MKLYLRFQLPSSIHALSDNDGTSDLRVPLEGGRPVLPAVGSLVQVLEVFHGDAEEGEVDGGDPCPGLGAVVAHVTVVRGL